MKNKLRNTIILLVSIILLTAVAYASVTIAKTNKSAKLPWQGTPSGQYDQAHNVGDTYAPQDRFTVGTDTEIGTVKDSVTGLMWQQNGSTAGTRTWANAITYCNDLSLGGYIDWRLPNIKELQSIIDYSRNSPSIDTSKFTSTASSYYWSSTTSSDNTSNAWIVHFHNATSNSTFRTNAYYVSCVR